MSAGSVVVVGGGLAGIATALRAADTGSDVALVERRSSLGGRTWSFERSGRSFDNGQHVFMRCCTRYLAFLDRIGARDLVHLQDRLDVPVLSPGRPVRHLRRNALPAPLQLGVSLARYHHLSAAEKLRVARISLALRRLDLADPALDEISFGRWLADHGEQGGAVAPLWDLICRPTVNLPADQASLALAAKVFRTGLLDRSDAADIGWSAVPLAVLHGERARAALASAGVEVRTGEKVLGIGPGSVTLEDDHLVADAIVVAVTPDAAARLVPGVGIDSDGLGVSPIVNVHVVYDRPVLDHPFAAAIDSPVEYVFDRSDSSGAGAGEQVLAVSLSAAEQWIGMAVDELVERFTSELARLLPAAAGAEVLDAVVTREQRATFHGGPGSGSLRPGPVTGIPGVFLAGDWTDTGWPATMEGAVRSGESAAAAVAAWLTDRPAGAGVVSAAVPDVLTRARDLTEPALRDAVAWLAPELRLPAEYHFGWVDADGHPSEGGGKGIRPALAILGAEAVGGTAADGVPVAVAVELIHNFSLLHDDIIDDDRERRHRPTVWATFGVGEAIIVGDALQTLAFEVLHRGGDVADTTAARMLSRSTQAMIRGQAMDMAFDRRAIVTPEECEAMEADKTGALLAYSVAAGAVLGGAGADTVGSLERFGTELGLAFQAVDDILGIWGDSAVTGKPAGNDLRERKKSVPVALALAAGGERAARLLEIFDAEVAEAEVAEAAALIEASGARAATEAVARRHLVAALAALERPELVAGAAAELDQLAHFVVEREH